MPGMDGIELGKSIRQCDADAKIIYISSSRDFAFESYEARAFYYILKPVEPQRLESVLDLAIDALKTDSEKKLNIRTQNGTVRVSKNDIIFVELNDRRSRYVLVSREINSLHLRSSFISENSALLDDSRFFVCGASLIVNLSYIKGVKKNGNILLRAGDSDEFEIPIPLRHLAALKSAWMNYCLEVEP